MVLGSVYNIKKPTNTQVQLYKFDILFKDRI